MERGFLCKKTKNAALQHGIMSKTHALMHKLRTVVGHFARRAIFWCVARAVLVRSGGRFWCIAVSCACPLQGGAKAAHPLLYSLEGDGVCSDFAHQARAAPDWRLDSGTLPRVGSCSRNDIQKRRPAMAGLLGQKLRLRPTLSKVAPCLRPTVPSSCQSAANSQRKPVWKVGASWRRPNASMWALTSPPGRSKVRS